MKSLDQTKVVIGVLIGVLAVALYFTISFYQKNSNTSKQSDLENITSGEAVYTDVNGIPVDLSQYEGKTLIINSWASWSPFSATELPTLSKIGQQYSNNNVVVLAINRMESPATARAFIKHIGSPEGVVFLLDDEDTFYNSIEGFSMPETVFYDTDGTIIFHKRGSISSEDLSNQIETQIPEDT
jgi:thiol-disulfide isomerase/thioredoxin